MSPKADIYRERDSAIVRHVGVYEISHQSSISRLFFEGKPCGHVLRRMAEEGLLQLIKLEGGISIVRLTEKAAARAGLPPERGGKAIGSLALNKAIAVLSYCTMLGDRKYRLERTEVEEALGMKCPTNQVHAISKGGVEICISRIQLVQGAIDAAVTELERKIDSASPRLVAAMENGHYGFVLLTETQARSQALASAVARRRGSGMPEIVVCEAATAKTLASFLRKRRST